MLDLKPLFKDYLDRELRRPPPDEVIFPSQLHTCLRKSYYRRRKPKKPSLWERGKFKMGDRVHSLVSTILRQSDEVEIVHREKPFTICLSDSPVIIRGRYDFMLSSRNAEDRFLLEVKSIANFRYFDEPYEHHLRQANLYLKGTPARKGILLYVSKYNLETRQFTLNFDREMFEESVDVAKRLYNLLLADRLPSRHEGYPDSYLCKNCDWRDECKKNKI